MPSPIAIGTNRKQEGSKMEETKQELQGAQLGTGVSTLGSPKLGRGHEDETTQDDYEIPRAKVVQFTSEEAQAVDAADRIQPGTFINGLSKRPISTNFIPVYRFKTYTMWNGRKGQPSYDPAFEPGAMIWSTNDRHDPKIGDGLDFGASGEPPKVTQSFNFLCYFQGEKIPMVLSFAKTSFKGGKRLNTLLMEAGGDMFSNAFRVIFSQAENNGNKYYVMDVRANGKASEDEFKLCEAWYNEFRGKDISARVQPEVATADHQ